MHPRRRPDITRANVQNLFQTCNFHDTVAHRLAGAVKIPTVTYDGMGHVGRDPRWDIFFSFSDYMRETFPRVLDHPQSDPTNHGLPTASQVPGTEGGNRQRPWVALHLAGFRGRDQTTFIHGPLRREYTVQTILRLVLVNRLQVVPAGEATSEEWTYPPFSGHYDGEFIWGRGSEDDKSNLIAMLSAIDCLLDCDFKPQRTVIVSVGFDEEGGAEQSYGARCLAETLIERYGKGGVELIVRELRINIPPR